MRLFAFLITFLLVACPSTNQGDDDDTAGDDDVGDDDTTQDPPVDADGDGYADDEDCDDEDPLINPGADEVCDGEDNDCDGQVDDEDQDVTGQSTWYTDGDGDGYGDPGSAADACDPPSGTVADDTDCDDGDPDVHPGAEEVAGDGIDNDCNGWTDIDADLPTVDKGWTVEVYADGIDLPMALAFDSAGFLYVGHDEVTDYIHVVDPGGGTAGLFGPAIQDPDGVAVGIDDTVYVGSEEGLWRVLPNGTSELFVTENMGNNTFVLVDFDATFGTAGTLFVANARHATDIVQVTTAGASTAFTSSPSLYVPFGMCFADGLIYVTEVEEGLEGVYTVDATGAVAPFLTVGFNTPHGIVEDEAHNWFFVGDSGDNLIYTMSPVGDLTVFAEGVAPRGFTMDDQGRLYVSDHTTDPERILRFSAN